MIKHSVGLVRVPCAKAEEINVFVNMFFIDFLLTLRRYHFFFFFFLNYPLIRDAGDGPVWFDDVNSKWFSGKMPIHYSRIYFLFVSLPF